MERENKKLLRLDIKEVILQLTLRKSREIWGHILKVNILPHRET